MEASSPRNLTLQVVSIVVAWELSALGDSFPDLHRTAVINAIDALSFG